MRARRAQDGRDPLRAQDDREHRLLGARVGGSALDRVGDLVRGRGHGRDEEDDDARRRAGRASSGGSACAYVAAVAPPSMSTGFARLASAGSSAPSAATVSSPSAGSSSPAASQASAQRIPSPPAFVRIATRGPAAPAASRAARRRRSAPRATPRGSRPPGGRARRRRPPSRRAPPCASSPRAAPVAVVAALQRQDRLPARDAPRDAGRTGAGCRTTRRRAARRPSPGRPPTTRAGRSTRRPPCSRSRRTPRGRGRATPPPRAARGRARRSATRSRCCRAARTRAAKVALRLGPADGDAEAVRADQPRPVRADEREQPLLALDALAADLGEAGRDDDERAHARRAAPASAARARRPPGRQITARSTGSGISSTDVYARTPATGSPSRLTGYAAPAKSPARMFRKSSPPIEPRRREAPTTATLARLEERPQRGDDGRVVALVDVRLGSAPSARSGTAPRPRRSRARASARSPRASKTPSMSRLSGSTSATKRSMPDSRGPSRRAARGAACRCRGPGRSSATAKAASASAGSRSRT